MTSHVLQLIAGECQAKVNINTRAIHATFVAVDVDKQLPLLGRVWMSLLQFDSLMWIIC